MISYARDLHRDVCLVINPGAVDDCSVSGKTVSGAVVIFAYHDVNPCDIAHRCNQAADVGAIGCLDYSAPFLPGLIIDQAFLLKSCLTI